MSLELHFRKPPGKEGSSLQHLNAMQTPLVPRSMALALNVNHRVAGLAGDSRQRAG